MKDNTKLLVAAKCALADLEGIMPEFEPSGDRTHPAWKTIKELKSAIKNNSSVDNLKTYSLVYEHKHGINGYVFKSKKDYNSCSERMLNSLLKKLDINDFEPDFETINIVEIENDIQII